MIGKVLYNLVTYKLFLEHHNQLPLNKLVTQGMDPTNGIVLNGGFYRE